jgi:hypothetical protein
MQSKETRRNDSRLAGSVHLADPPGDGQLVIAALAVIASGAGSADARLVDCISWRQLSSAGYAHPTISFTFIEAWHTGNC